MFFYESCIKWPCDDKLPLRNTILQSVNGRLLRNLDTIDKKDWRVYM